ncbi:MAG: sigma-70 family RNA polymerase sigma factor [Actinobacteria bacterium]|nr:MAG: sigma-70 family RNA polymerase sigma factor [Actinomycetota bacterium]
MVVRSLEDARDRDLVRRVIAKDEEAFRSLFRRYAPMAKALALRVVRQTFVAEEIVQEAFLALWRNPGAFREDRGSFRAWMLSTVHHRAVDAVRREEAWRRRSREHDPDALVAEDVGATVVEELDHAAMRREIRAALDQLPAEQRQVLEMMYFEAKTQSMIAEELKLPLGTVKSRTLLGMRRLRDLVVEEGS